MKDKIYRAVPISEVNLSSLKKDHEYFVIKDFKGIDIKHTSWFNGINFDSAQITHVLEAVSLPSEEEIKVMAAEYAKKIDPLNMTPEKQADIYMGFIEGVTQLMLKIK